MAVAVRAQTNQVPKATTPERSYTGIVSYVNTNDQTFRVKRWLLPGKQFAYGKTCAITLSYAMLNNGLGTAEDLRRGEKVTVGYENAHGVLIAGRIEQRPMQFTGTVKEINVEKHLLTLHHGMLNKRLTIATDCIIDFHNEKAGTLSDIHPGDHVVVIYEIPDDVPMAWQITKEDPSAGVKDHSSANRQ